MKRARPSFRAGLEVLLVGLRMEPLIDPAAVAWARSFRLRRGARPNPREWFEVLQAAERIELFRRQYGAS